MFNLKIAPFLYKNIIVDIVFETLIIHVFVHNFLLKFIILCVCVGVFSYFDILNLIR